jgi:hypothetical protein
MAVFIVPPCVAVLNGILARLAWFLATEIGMPLDDDILAAYQPLLDDLATQSLASLAEFDLSFLRDVPRARRRSFRQRDLSRALRAAKAAGITGAGDNRRDGRLILETGATAITKPAGAQSWDVAIDQASLKIHPRLS